MRFRKKHKNSQAGVIIGLIIAVLLMLGLYSFWTLRYIAWELDDLGELSTDLAANLNQTGLNNNLETLTVAQATISDIQTQLNKLSFIRTFPVINRTYFYLNDIFYQGEKALVNLRTLGAEYEAFGDLTTTQGVLAAYLQQTTPTEFGATLDRVGGEFSQLSKNLDVLNGDLIHLADSWLLRNQRQALMGLATGLGNFVQATQQASDLLKLAPSFLGYPEPVTYLVLLQNNHEIRPTGGFIGTYGIITIDRGRIVDFYTDDIYHLDSQVIGQLEIEPPLPISKYLGVQSWYLRDINWSPDFPTTAQAAMQFYALEGGSETLNGVLAVTPEVISDVLALTGEVWLDDVVYQADDFTNTLQYEVEQNYQARGESHWDRKDVIGELAEILLQRILALPLKQTIVLVDVLHSNLNEKNLQLYLLNPEQQAFVSHQNWSGEIRPAAKDYLLVVDSNMAAFKTNQFVSRTIDYQVSRETTATGQRYLSARLKITYQHSGDFSWDTTRYRTYTRVYVPAGAVLSSWSGAMANDRTSELGQIDFYQENGKTVWGAFIAIEPGESGELVFEYRLPDELLSDYQLLYQIQPGLVDDFTASLLGQNFVYSPVNEDVTLVPTKY